VIASFSSNFVFIRTRKTASTSAEIVLGTWCGEDDIVTPVGVEDEIIRLEYGGSPSNFCDDLDLERRYQAALPSRNRHLISMLYKEVMQNLTVHHHMGAAELIPMLPPSFWRSAFKFTVDRHPYEKLLSMTYWRKRKAVAAGACVLDFVDEYIDRGEYRNFDLYCVDGRLAVDRVIRFEFLWNELAEVARRIGKTLPTHAPRSKSQYRNDRKPARNILSANQKGRIYDICREEFDLLGYDR
jgi:hypothetical protein